MAQSWGAASPALPEWGYCPKIEAAAMTQGKEKPAEEKGSVTLKC